MINHTAINLITKGLLNISIITKGMISGYILSKKGGGGGDLLYSEFRNKEELFRDIKKYQNDVDVIKLKINWNKVRNENVKIDVKLLKKNIEIEILKEINKKVTVELI